MPLEKESCVPCRAGAEPLSPAEIGTLSREAPGWTVAARGGVRRLEKEFPFPDFAAALAFAVRVGEMADRQDHHPEVTVAWGKAAVAWWTHRVKGLHRNDFVCAAKTDAIAADAAKAAGLTAPTEIAKVEKP